MKDICKRVGVLCMQMWQTMSNDLILSASHKLLYINDKDGKRAK